MRVCMRPRRVRLGPGAKKIQIDEEAGKKQRKEEGIWNGRRDLGSIV